VSLIERAIARSNGAWMPKLICGPRRANRLIDSFLIGRFGRDKQGLISLGCSAPLVNYNPFVDNNQIVQGRRAAKLGPVLPQRARPRSRPPSPDENPRGRGSYFPNQLWRSVGAEIISDRVQAVNAAPSLESCGSCCAKNLQSAANRSCTSRQCSRAL
jgi:hypothetical protein